MDNLKYSPTDLPFYYNDFVDTVFTMAEEICVQQEREEDQIRCCERTLRTAAEFLKSYRCSSGEVSMEANSVLCTSAHVPDYNWTEVWNQTTFDYHLFVGDLKKRIQDAIISCDDEEMSLELLEHFFGSASDALYNILID